MVGITAVWQSMIIRINEAENNHVSFQHVHFFRIQFYANIRFKKYWADTR